MTRNRQPARAIAEPAVGWFRMRLVRGGPWVGARIYRSLGHLVGEINGDPCDASRVWESGEMIPWDRWKLLDENRPDAPDVAINVRTLKTF